MPLQATNDMIADIAVDFMGHFKDLNEILCARTVNDEGTLVTALFAIAEGLNNVAAAIEGNGNG